MDFASLAQQYGTPALVVAIIGFVVSHFLSGYSNHKKDVYRKIEERVKDGICKERREAIDKQINEHKQDGNHERI